MVTACYKPVVNGVTRMIALYKAELEAMGHEVHIFTLGEPDPAGDEPGVVRSSAVALGESGYYVSVRYSSQAQALMQKMDILHCHHLFMSVEMAHRYAHCPIVYTNHTRYDLYTGTYAQLPQPAADALMRRVWPDFTDFADVVITPSQSVRQVMRDFGVRRPITVIENGIPIAPFRHPSNPFCKAMLGIPETAVLMAYAGRLSSEKDLALLLQQVAIVVDLAPDTHLMLIGGGPMEDDLRQMTVALGIDGNVHFTGAVAYADIPNYLASADFFVTASQTEVHPLTVIEAQAAGLPVVGVASPGLVDTILQGVSGMLTRRPEGGLSAAMAVLAFDKGLRQQFARGAVANSQRFDIKQTVEKTLLLYEQLCAERPDLSRKKEHGRWLLNRDKLQPLVTQLSRLLKPTADRVVT